MTAFITNMWKMKSNLVDWLLIFNMLVSLLYKDVSDRTLSFFSVYIEGQAKKSFLVCLLRLNSDKNVLSGN